MIKEETVKKKIDAIQLNDCQFSTFLFSGGNEAQVGDAMTFSASAIRLLGAMWRNLRELTTLTDVSWLCYSPSYNLITLSNSIIKTLTFVLSFDYAGYI